MFKTTTLYVDKFLNLLAVGDKWKHTRQNNAMGGSRLSVTNETHSSVLIQLFNAKFSSNYVVFIFIKETKVNFILTYIYIYIYMKYFVKFSKKLCNLLF